jgi:hypothetical protein
MHDILTINVKVKPSVGLKQLMLLFSLSTTFIWQNNTQNKSQYLSWNTLIYSCLCTPLFISFFFFFIIYWIWINIMRSYYFSIFCSLLIELELFDYNTRRSLYFSFIDTNHKHNLREVQQFYFCFIFYSIHTCTNLLSLIDLSPYLSKIHWTKLINRIEYFRINVITFSKTSKRLHVG